jgi:nitrogenase molybdenum-cofactor synthesis protein NifE
MSRPSSKLGTSLQSACYQRSQPGEAAGACAFEGAKVVLQPITDAAHLVHGPLACEGNSWDNRHAASSGSDLYRRSFTTDLSELDLTLGNSEKRLYASIRQIVERHAPSAIFVYETCVTALIGDDVVGVCRVASERFGTPCVPVRAPGFTGSRHWGNRLAGDVLSEHVVGTIEPELIGDTDLNILGEFNLCGEFWNVAPLFEELGIRVHTCISGDARYAEIASCHRARVNMVVCSVALQKLARSMQDRYGIPYFEGSFYGIANTSQTLRTAASLLVERGADPSLIERTERLIAREQALVWQKVEPQRARLSGKRALLHTGSVKAWSLVSALQEAGCEVVGTTIRKATTEDQRRARAALEDETRAFESLPANGIQAHMVERAADVLVTGGRALLTARNARMPALDINQERYIGYAGYRGFVELVRRLDLEVNSPVWKELRRPAPWDV